MTDYRVRIGATRRERTTAIAHLLPGDTLVVDHSRGSGVQPWKEDLAWLVEFDDEDGVRHCRYNTWGAAERHMPLRLRGIVRDAAMAVRNGGAVRVVWDREPHFSHLEWMPKLWRLVQPEEA